jgi:hypothetical protein
MAYSPFDTWSRMVSAGWSMATLGLRAGETLVAADSVVRHRSAAIDHAMRNPLAADHTELTGMITEKAEAFGRAGASIAADMTRLQSDMFAQASAVAAMWMTGMPPTARTYGEMANRSQRMMARAIGSGGRALAPIHAKATANAKRLERKRPR